MENEVLISNIENKKLTHKILLEKFQNALLNSGYSIESVNLINSRESLLIKKNDKTMRIHILLKNLSLSGWSEHPEIRRIQVSRDSLNNIPETSLTELFLLIGVGIYKNEDIFVLWNPKLYLSHATQCSCYVFISSIDKASIEGCYKGSNCGKEVYISNSKNIGFLIDSFLENNYVKQIDW